jgi:hypothetical protein
MENKIIQTILKYGGYEETPMTCDMIYFDIKSLTVPLENLLELLKLYQTYTDLIKIENNYICYTKVNEIRIS